MDILIYAALILLSATILIPFLHLFNLAFSPSHLATKGGLLLLPVEFTLDNYAKVLSSRFIWNGYRNTLLRTAVGTFVQLFFTALGAYAMSKKYFPHRS